MIYVRLVLNFFKLRWSALIQHSKNVNGTFHMGNLQFVSDLMLPKFCSLKKPKNKLDKNDFLFNSLAKY
jgi:hypothetical protein